MIKKIILGIVCFLTSTVALAGPYGHRHYGNHFHNRHWHHNHGWIAPVIIGGAIGYALARPSTTVVETPIVVQQQPPQYLNPQLVVIDGVTYLKQFVLINGVYTEVLIKQ